MLSNLWHQTLDAYLDSCLPVLFCERLSAYLSRFCAVPYCMLCHSCSLRPLGMRASQVLNMLEMSPPRVETLQGMVRSMGRLGALVSTLLDVARLSSGRLELYPEEPGLAEMVQQVSEGFQSEAARAG